MTAVHSRSRRLEKDQESSPQVPPKSRENYDLFCKGLGSVLFAGKELSDKKIVELMDKCPNEITTLFKAVAGLPKGKQQAVWKITDIHVAKKIADVQKRLERETGGTYHAESARTTAAMLTAFITHYLEKAPELADELRPKWMEYLITKENKECHFSAIGEQVCHFTRSHKKLILEVLQLNFLRAMTQLVERLQTVHKKNPYAVLDLIKELHMKATAHFVSCQSGNLEEKKKHAQEQFLKALTESLEKTFFPEGGKTLELPFSPLVRKHMDDYIMGVLRKALLPHLSRSLFDLLSSESTKTSMLYEMMSFIHKAVDEETPIELEKDKEITYPRFDELVQAMEGAIHSLLTYFDPSFLKWLESKVKTRVVAQALAKQVCLKFQSTSFLDMQKRAIQRSLPLLVDGGKWEKGGKFSLPAISFTTTPAEHQAKLARKAKETKEKATQLEEIAGKIGHKCDGLKSIIDKFLFGEKKQSESALGAFGGAVRRFAVSVGSAVTGAPVRIREFAKAILEKMPRQEHEPMLYEIAQVMLAVPGMGSGIGAL